MLIFFFLHIKGKFEIDLWQLSNLLASVMTLTTTAWQKKNDGSFSNSTEGRSNSEVNCIFGASIAIIAAQVCILGRKNANF